MLELRDHHLIDSHYLTLSRVLCRSLIRDYHGYFIFFFFQAEDGIRDYKVTGVQTCALPILRQLFVGIQVAGPQLKPPKVDEGFHSIPAVASTDPTVPACYYDPGDYTCIKDTSEERRVGEEGRSPWSPHH